MMRTREYQLLYLHARRARPGDLLEIGAGHGASSICLGLGLKDAGKPGRLFTVEKGEGGSRSRYGSKEDNTRILLRNVAACGLADRVTLIDQRLGSAQASLGEVSWPSGGFSLLFIDADGELGRDFGLFYERLVPEAFIVIDDYLLVPPTVLAARATGGHRAKFVKTRLWVDHFIESGLLVPLEMSGHTLFAVKPDDAPGINVIDEGRVGTELDNLLRRV